MTASDIDTFREQPNLLCKRCTLDVRKGVCSDGLCNDIVSKMDDLPLRCVGVWGQDKTKMLLRYLAIFAAGMKNKFSDNLHYIEICSGPGRLIDFETSREFDGSSIAFLRQPAATYLTDATFIDISDRVLSTLEKRIKNLNLEVPRVYVKNGDYTSMDSISKAVSHLDGRGLHLAFIDPTDMSIPFTTVEHLVKRLGRVDLLINVGFQDFVRNAKRAIKEQSIKDKYEKFLGSPGFFDSPDIIALQKRGDFENQIKAKARETLMNSLQKLGYKCFDYQPVRHYYEMLFASKHELGRKFWKDSLKSGQDQLSLRLS